MRFRSGRGKRESLFDALRLRTTSKVDLIEFHYLAFIELLQSLLEVPGLRGREVFLPHLLHAQPKLDVLQVIFDVPKHSKDFGF